MTTTMEAAKKTPHPIKVCTFHSLQHVRRREEAPFTLLGNHCGESIDPSEDDHTVHVLTRQMCVHCALGVKKRKGERGEPTTLSVAYGINLWWCRRNAAAANAAVDTWATMKR
eukprot:6436322-Amphidinium_carterae.1